MKLGRPLGILLVSASLVMTIGWLSRAPYNTPGSDAAVLRLSWRFRGEKEEECRPRTQAELDVLPVHMRTPEICEGHLSAYRLNVQIGDGHVASRVFVPQGAKGDRPIFVMQEMNLSSGPQRVRVRFAPIADDDDDGAGRHADAADDDDKEDAALVYEEIVNGRAGVVELITTDAAGRLIRRTGN